VIEMGTKCWAGPSFLNKKLGPALGMTLVETIVSVVIWGICLVVMLASFNMAKAGTIYAKHHMQAMNLVRMRAEGIMDTAYDDIVSTGPETLVVDAGPDMTAGTADDMTGQMQVQVLQIDIDGDEIPDPCKSIEISLSWQERAVGGLRYATVETVNMLRSE